MSVAVDIDRIGLVIWGVQSGYRVFCHNSAISDPNIPEIKATWGDLRSLVVVNNLSVVFYGLEFSKNYKVFTVYRPVNDFGRSGGYVAVTIYVPHQYKFHDIRELLESISQAYLSDHYSFGEPLNTPETIGRYQQMVVAQADSLALDDEFRSWPESEQNHMTKLLPFNDPSVVDNFFATPYREDFGHYQEIMFWNLSYLQNPAQFGITFLRELRRFELNGTDVSEEYQGDRISSLSGLTLTYFKRNGVECKDSFDKKGYYGPTRIAFELVKNEFYQPVSFDGTVDEAVQKGFLSRSGKSYGWRSGIRFEPKNFPLSIQFFGLEGVSSILKAGLDERLLREVRDGHLELELKGEEVQFQKSLFIEEFGLRRRVKVFVPDELPKYAGRYMLEVNFLRFVPLVVVGENADLPSGLSFKVRGFDGIASVDPKSVTGIILSDDQNLSDIELSTGKYESRLEEGRLILKKTHVLVRIMLPPSIGASVKASGARFGFRAKNGSLKILQGLEDEVRYNDLPGDVFKWFLFPVKTGNNVFFPFDDMVVEETSAGIVIKPRLMRVVDPDRVEFWVGSQTAQNRLWVCREWSFHPFIPEGTEFSSDDEDFKFEIVQRDGYRELIVGRRRVATPAVTPVEEYSDPKVGEVVFSKEGTETIATVIVFEHDKYSEGVYQIRLSREQNLYCYLPFPYDDNKYYKLQKSFDSRLMVNPTAANAYHVILKDETKKGKSSAKPGVKSGGGKSSAKSEIRSGGGKSTDAKREKSRGELPSWLIYVVGGVALLALLFGLWFILLYPGRKVGDVSFEFQNHHGYKEQIPITITDNPRYTKKNGNVLTIYKKYEKGGNLGKIKGLELSFGEKKDGKYTDGVVTIDGDMSYYFNSDKKETCWVDGKIPSLAALNDARELKDIYGVLAQYGNSVFIKGEAIDKAQEKVNDDPSLLETYQELFSRVDTSHFIENLQSKIDSEQEIETAKDELRKNYSSVRSMDCTIITVNALKDSYSKLLKLGVLDKEINALCGNKNCKELIEYYEKFFNLLEYLSYDGFKSGLGYNTKSGKSRIVTNTFSKEQQGVINLAAANSSNFKYYYGHYTGRLNPSANSFKGLLALGLPSTN